MAELRKAIAQLMERRRPPQPAAHANIADQILAELRAEASPAERPLLDVFVPVLFDHNRDLEPRAGMGAQLVAIARNAFRFVQHRSRAFQTRVYRTDSDQHGREPTTVVEILTDHSAIADSASAAVRALGGHVDLLLHASFLAHRDDQGALNALEPASGAIAAGTESFLLLQVSGVEPALLEHAVAQLDGEAAPSPATPPRGQTVVPAPSAPAPVAPASVASSADAAPHELFDRWDSELRQHLALRYGPGEVERLAARYLAALPPAYKTVTATAAAVGDIRALEMLSATGTTQIELVADATQPDRHLTALKLYLRGDRLVLSEFIPVLENLGLRVFSEDCITVRLPDTGTVELQTFLVQDLLHGTVDISRAAPLLVPALHALRAGQCENDPLNRLILHAGLEWRAVAVLRTYVEHARQAGVAASRSLLYEALTAQPDAARRIFRLFTAAFDPTVTPVAADERLVGPVAEAQAAFQASLDHVDSLLHDRLLRALGAAVSATVRTNFFRPPAEGPERSAIAIKLDCRRLRYLPDPRALFETYVHAPHVDAVHLRAGRVARGGIRLSDRPDDFRREVLDLMKTQVVKNAVIVPVGAKGGFVLKGWAAGQPASPDRIVLAYRTFIDALLSVTDNREAGRVVPPAGQVCYDAPDPYLVVAADKGTGTLSDIANAVAARYHFWLGDAFASGGSQGYDHKELGITARGVWECVRLHFREMGRDADREPLTVIGIGDMSGDVFGNGLLRGPHLVLRAAFNHSHIFLDPNPDPAAALAERQRLFQSPGSNWSDYQPAAISAGGGVYARRAKRIPLHPAVRAMLGVERESLTGEELVSALLTMEADLLWNGGIGTYVKASTESHAEIGDPANDSVRVDASALRVRVVGEGGNLGFSQAARVEFALHGGRINTDAVDNSAGVVLSDHEVNLKIALQPLVIGHVMTLADRSRLLDELSDDVCARVVAQNRHQARAIGIDQVRSRTQMVAFRALTAWLEKSPWFDRQLERLPSREALRDRRGTFVGLTRPELAVLLAYAKLDLQHRFVDGSLTDDPAVQHYLDDYFPTQFNERCADAVRQHPLRHEIIAVQLATRLVDRMGMTFAVRVASNMGRDIGTVLRAWAAAADVGDVEDVYRRIETTHGNDDPELIRTLYVVLAESLEAATKWLVQARPEATSIADFIGPLADCLGQVLSNSTERHRAEANRLIAAGADTAIASAVARIVLLADALAVAAVATGSGCPAERAIAVYDGIDALVDTGWIRRSLRALSDSDDRWERRAVEGLLEGLVTARRRLAHDLLACAVADAPVAECLERYRITHSARLGTLRALIDDLRSVERPTLAALLVVMRELYRLVDRE